MMYPQQLKEIGLLVGDEKAMELIAALVEKAYQDGYEEGHDDGQDMGYSMGESDLREKILDLVRGAK